MVTRTRNEVMKPAVAAWLGAGAITVGVGAALTAGAAVADASTGDPGGASTSSASHSDASAHGVKSVATDAGSKDDGATKTEGAAAPGQAANPRHRNPSDTTASGSTPTATTSHGAGHVAKPKPAGANLTTRDEGTKDVPVKPKSATTTAATSTTPSGTTTPVETTASTGTVESTGVTPTSTATGSTAPVLTTAPKATHAATIPGGSKIASGTTIASGTKSNAPAVTTPPPSNPLAAIGVALQSFLHGIQTQYFNRPPTVTGVVGPTKNADGTYGGQVVAVDADGDPLKYTVAAPYSGSSLTIDGSGNYTYVPDAEDVAAGKDYTEVVYATVEESNVGTHYHGVSEIVAKALDPILKPILAPLYAAFGQRYVGYFAGNYETVQVPISITVTFGGTAPTRV